MSGEGEKDEAGDAHRGARTLDLDPRVVLLPGRGDATALLAVWLVRKSFWPLLWIGLAGVSLAGRGEGFDAGSFESWGDVVRALASPVAGVILAVGVRLAAAGIAFVLAYRVARSVDAIQRAVGTGWWKTIVLFNDQLHVTRAYRALRWTKAVRDEATSRLGRAGERFAFVERILFVLTVALAVGVVVVAALS